MIDYYRDKHTCNSIFRSPHKLKATDQPGCMVVDSGDISIVATTSNALNDLDCNRHHAATAEGFQLIPTQSLRSMDPIQIFLVTVYKPVAL